MSVQIPEPGEGSREPARTAGVVTSIAGAVLTIVVAFGLELTPGQTAAILGLATVLAPLAQAAWTRRQVWAPQTVGWLMRGRGPVRLQPANGVAKAWRWGFLGLTALVVVLELIAAFDKSEQTRPWTVEIVEHIPMEITFAAIGALILWLPIHFGMRYWRKHQSTQGDSSDHS